MGIQIEDVPPYYQCECAGCASCQATLKPNLARLNPKVGLAQACKGNAILRAMDFEDNAGLMTMKYEDAARNLRVRYLCHHCLTDPASVRAASNRRFICDMCGITVAYRSVEQPRAADAEEDDDPIDPSDLYPHYVTGILSAGIQLGDINLCTSCCEQAGTRRRPPLVGKQRRLAAGQNHETRLAILP